MRRSSRAGAAGLLAISLLTDLVAPGIAPAAETSVVNEVQDRLQISAEQRRRLVRGEVVSYAVTENSERELAIGFAMIVPVPMSEIADYLASGQMIAQDDAISEFGAVPDEASTGNLGGPRFYWIKRRVQRRPHLSLLHRIVVADSGSIIHVERYFYAGHSFNATEILTGAFAHRDGPLVFSINRVSTDEVLGVGNQLKGTIGHAQLRDDMRVRLDRLRAFLIRPRSTQSP